MYIRKLPKNAHATYSINWNQLCVLVMSVGHGKYLIDFTWLLSASTLSSLSSKPQKSRFFFANLNFPGFIIIPASSVVHMFYEDFLDQISPNDRIVDKTLFIFKFTSYMIKPLVIYILGSQEPLQCCI